MSYVPVGAVVINLPHGGIRNNWSIAIITHMVRTAVFIKDNVPINPAFYPVAHISNDVSAITLTGEPLSYLRAALLTAFSKNKMRFGECIVQPIQVFKLLGDIPVVSYSPYVASCFFVREHLLSSFKNQIPVMVPNEEFQAGKSGPGKSRTKVIAHKIPLFSGSVQARVPDLHSRRLILYGYCIYTDSLRRHSLQIANVIVGPDLSKFRTQCAPAIHVSVALHPFRWAPGRGKQEKRAAGNCLSLMDSRKYPARFPGNIEGFERLIMCLYIAVVLQ